MKFNKETSEDINIQVINATGKIVYENQGYRMSKSQVLNINLEDQAEGIYFLNIDYEDNITVEKVIIR